jgi:hypothetical protein
MKQNWKIVTILETTLNLHHCHFSHDYRVDLGGICIIGSLAERRLFISNDYSWNLFNCSLEVLLWATNRGTAQRRMGDESDYRSTDTLAKSVVAGARQPRFFSTQPRARIYIAGWTLLPSFIVEPLVLGGYDV